MGWVCNEAKSTWVPMHRLSFTIGLELGLIMVPDKKIEAFERKLITAMEQPMLKARIIASLVGIIISMSLKRWSVARFMTHALYALLLTRQAWCDMFPLKSEVYIHVYTK